MLTALLATSCRKEAGVRDETCGHYLSSSICRSFSGLSTKHHPSGGTSWWLATATQKEQLLCHTEQKEKWGSAKLPRAVTCSRRGIVLNS